MKFELHADNNQVTAASISRIMRHFDTGSLTEGVAIVSADRTDRGLLPETDTEALTGPVAIVNDHETNEAYNKAARKRLEGVLKGMGKGFIKTKGGYQERGASSPSYEYSYVVPRVSEDEAKKLAKILGKGAAINDQPDVKKVDRLASLQKDFRQDSILWGNLSAGIFLFWYNGTKDKIGAKFEPSTLQQYFTEWRKRRFGFASACLVIEYIPDSPSDYRQWRREVIQSIIAMP